MTHCGNVALPYSLALSRSLNSCLIHLFDPFRIQNGEKLTKRPPPPPQALINCGHVYHLSCIRKWFQCKANGRPPHAPCPKCKEPYDMGSTVTIYLDVRKDADGVPTAMNTPAAKNQHLHHHHHHRDDRLLEDADGTIVLDSPLNQGQDDDGAAADGAADAAAAAAGGGGGVGGMGGADDAAAASLAAMPQESLAARCAELTSRVHGLRDKVGEFWVFDPREGKIQRPGGGKGRRGGELTTAFFDVTGRVANWESVRLKSCALGRATR